MEQHLIAEAIHRIRKMEALFDALQRPEARNAPDFSQQLQTLIAYYEGSLWLQDFQMDEEGFLPPDLKRGILSEDAVYNFLSGLNP